MRKYGLIGFPLTHSFSKKYFSDKFNAEHISDKHSYELFEIEDATKFVNLFENDEDLVGLNVTIPHKQAVQPFLQHLDDSAKKVGAVNVIKKSNKGLTGYNSDYYGFKRSLEEFLKGKKISNALVLGNGGAAKAIKAVLKDLEIFPTIVSRRRSKNAVSYREAKAITPFHHLIINCSPVGTYPNEHECPDLDYDAIGESHYLFDLVYNPEETLFLSKGKAKGASIRNGYDMLVYQAEKSWEIWNN